MANRSNCEACAGAFACGQTVAKVYTAKLFGRLKRHSETFARNFVDLCNFHASTKFFTRATDKVVRWMLSILVHTASDTAGWQVPASHRV